MRASVRFLRNASQSLEGSSSKLRVILLIAGILLATAGGMITYRAIYLEPSSTVVITESQVRELPNYSRIIGGTILLVGGAALALLAVHRRAK